jgi:hypothetical protein
MFRPIPPSVHIHESDFVILIVAKILYLQIGHVCNATTRVRSRVKLKRAGLDSILWHRLVY